jgi:hypothetical protein
MHDVDAVADFADNINEHCQHEPLQQLPQPAIIHYGHADGSNVNVMMATMTAM